MPEAKVGVTLFNDSIQNLEDKIDSFVDRFESKLEKEVSGVKDLIIKRLQADNMVLHERIKSLESKLEYNLQYQACHYIPSKNGKMKVIVKVINRKHADSTFRKRSLLKHSV